MKMRAIDSLALPAGKTVELKPGGYHLMLLDLAQPLKEGDNVPMVLTFADGKAGKTTQEVKAHGSRTDHDAQALNAHADGTSGAKLCTAQRDSR